MAKAGLVLRRITNRQIPSWFQPSGQRLIRAVYAALQRASGQTAQSCDVLPFVVPVTNQTALKGIVGTITNGKPAADTDKPLSAAEKALAAFTFGSASECIFSLPERGNVTAKKDKQGNPYTIQPIGEITIPLSGSTATVVSTVWSEKRSNDDNPDTVKESISFSLPRGLNHSYMNLTPKTDAWFDAKDSYNEWRSEVLNAFLSWQSAKASRQTVGGNVVRHVAKPATEKRPAK